MPRAAIALILSLAYAGLIVLVAGVQPANGFPMWFFAPGAVAMGASLIAQAGRALPAPWQKGDTGGEPPRAVQLSWNAALRLPSYVPILFFPWYLLAIMRLHFDMRMPDFVAGVLLLWICLHGMMRSAKEIALLREGAVAQAVVERLDRDRYGTYKVWYRFDAPGGASHGGTAYHPGPVPVPGGTIPVYVDLNDTRRHVIAGASWFEAG